MDQRKAFDYAIAGGGFKVINSVHNAAEIPLLQAICGAHKKDQYRVIGMASGVELTKQLGEKVGFAQDEVFTVDQFLKAFKGARRRRASGIKSGKIDGAYSMKLGGKDVPAGKTVILVHQAKGMRQEQEARLFDAAEKMDAKIIYVGDPDAQNSHQRGGMFPHYHRIANGRELSSLFNQRAKWVQSLAGFVRGFKLREVLSLILRADKRKEWDPRRDKTWMRGITGARTMDRTETCLVRSWMRDTVRRTLEGERFSVRQRFVFAFNKRTVESLNKRLQGVRVKRGAVTDRQIFRCHSVEEDMFDGGRFVKGASELSPHEKRTTKSLKTQKIGIGDRIQTKAPLKAHTSKKEEIRVEPYALATVHAIENRPDGERRMRIRVDGETQDIYFNADAPDANFGLGYAGSQHRGQMMGQNYILPTRQWFNKPALHAWTRSRERPKLFVSETVAKTTTDLAKLINRGLVQSGSALSYMMPDAPDKDLEAEQKWVREAYERAVQDINLDSHRFHMKP